MARTLDYDTPRAAADDTIVPDSLEQLQTHRLHPPPGDFDDVAPEEVFEVPDPILDEELTGPVIPVQVDEFRCERCFLICHASRMAGNGVCNDCA